MILNDNRKIASGIGLMDEGTLNGNRMIQDDGIMHGVGTCHGMSLHATDDGIVGTRHGVSPPHGVSTPHVVSPPHGVSTLPSIYFQKYQNIPKWWIHPPK